VLGRRKVTAVCAFLSGGLFVPLEICALWCMCCHTNPATGTDRTGAPDGPARPPAVIAPTALAASYCLSPRPPPALSSPVFILSGRIRSALGSASEPSSRSAECGTALTPVTQPFRAATEAKAGIAAIHMRVLRSPPTTTSGVSLS
jgi:hypothetical protein